MNVIMIIISALICYLLGSISTSILVGKASGLGDIRKHGSGNAGATNTLRVLGKKAAIWTVLGDVLKTVIAVLVARFISKNFIADSGMAELSIYISCLFTAVGHNFPIYFKFKGGKGVLTSGVIIIMLNPLIGSVTVVTALLTMAVTKYVSLGSIVGGVLYPLWIIIWYTDDVMKMVFALLMGGMLIIKHSANIGRLINGTESKLGAKKTSDGE